VAESTIIRCPSCDTANRVRPTSTGVPQCASCHEKLPWIVSADDASFEDERVASVPVLVDFWAPWCGPCRMVSPVLERIARAQAGKVKIVKVNTDEQPGLARRFDARSIPLLVLMRDGEEVDRRVGALPQAQLESWLGAHQAARGG
jgi:thioredoxin 2